MTSNEQKPTLSPKLLTTDEEMLVRAVEKWLKFQTSVWDHVNCKLEPRISRIDTVGILLRIIIIVTSALLTTLSGIELISTTMISIIAGTLTALTGIEAYLKLNETETQFRRQQREIEALRDKLRYEWFVKVEIEGDMQKRLNAAKKLLEEGPNAYNEILNKYSLKAYNGGAPTLNEG